MSTALLSENLATLAPIFNAVQTGVILVNSDYRIILMNSLAEEMLGKDLASIGDSQKCYELFADEDGPCDHCPRENLETACPPPKSVAFKKGDGTDVLIKVHYHSIQDSCLLTLFNVTKEVTLLRKIDLSRKELQAKNILLERSKNKTGRENEFLQQLIDSLPDALMAVDKNLNALNKNAAVAEIFPEGSGETCYELIGNDFPCDPCPAEHGFASDKELKKIHEVGGKFYTEIIAQSPKEGGGLLLFRDTTRQIGLIGQIREQQESITRQNNILSGLVNFGARMQKETEASGVVDFFLDLFLPVINSTSCAILVDDIRPGKLWLTLKRGVDEEYMKWLSRGYFSRDFQTGKVDSLQDEFLPWEECTQIRLLGGDGSRVGLILFEGGYEKGENDLDLVKLFSEPMGAYLHNRLLLKKLEEKANTDALTGLYNRGYLDRVLEEEVEKFQSYSINFALVVADVNRLKMANDVYGHEAGDRLIVAVSNLLRETVRETDIVARVGGDEFLILLTNSNAENAQAFIKRLKNHVFNEVFMDVGDNEKFPVMISLGAAGTDTHAPGDLAKEADKQMYADKEEYYKTQKRYR